MHSPALMGGLQFVVSAALLISLATLADAQSSSDGGKGGTQLVIQSLSAHPAAICNDGSPGAYYYHAGSDPNLFVVYLQGGFWCLDEKSCAVRQRFKAAQMSSRNWPASLDSAGIFSTDSTLNDFAGANMARNTPWDRWFKS